MKILEICPFSSGICNTWNRVKQESLEFSRLGHKVAIFSSDVEKGTDKVLERGEKMGNVNIYRFPTKKYFFSKNMVYFDFEKQLEILSPDLVITHLSHPHSFKALKICKKMDIPIFIVTRPSFDTKRNFLFNQIIKIYSSIKIKPYLKYFDKIISITNWEMSSFQKLKVPEEKVAHIPNGIAEDFFTQKFSKELHKILFLGRILPIKNLEILIGAAKKLPKIKFSIVGSAEKKYLEKIQKNLPENVEIKEPIYNLKEKIKLIDEHKIFVLPSKKEAMPQSLIEAMSREKIVISSNTNGGKEIIQNGKNGFLFDIGDMEQLTKLIKINIRGKKQIKENAKRFAQKYSWKKLIKKYEKLIEECYQ